MHDDDSARFRLEHNPCEGIQDKLYEVQDERDALLAYARMVTAFANAAIDNAGPSLGEMQRIAGVAHLLEDA